MSAENIPLWGNPEVTRETPFATLGRAVKRLLKEKTGPKRNLRQELAAFYVGMTLADETLRGLMTEQDVDSKLAELKLTSLPLQMVERNYRFFMSQGGTFQWLDIGFQLDTLERYLPEILERVKPIKPKKF